MKNKYKLLGLYLPIFIAATIATVVIRTIALFNDFDLKTGYFTDKSLISVGDYIVIGMSILFLTYILTARRDLKMIPDFTSPATYAPTGIIAAALVFVGISFFSKAAEQADIIFNRTTQALGSEWLVLLLAVIVGILALVSVVHFALCALIEKGTDFRRGDFGIVTVAFLALYSIYLYFDSSLPLNSPAKNLDQMVYLFAAVFFLYETRLSIGREKWRGYLAFGFIAALLSAYSSIPALIYYFIEGAEVSIGIYEMILSAAIFIFVTSRIFLTGELIEDVESPFAKIFSEASNLRTATIKPLVTESEAEEPTAEAIDENQITIDDVCIDEAEKSDSADEAATPTKEDANESAKEDSTSVSEEKNEEIVSVEAKEAATADDTTADTADEKDSESAEASATAKSEDESAVSDDGEKSGETVGETQQIESESESSESIEASPAAKTTDGKDTADSISPAAKAEDGQESSATSESADGADEAKNTEEKSSDDSSSDK